MGQAKTMGKFSNFQALKREASFGFLRKTLSEAFEF